MRMSHDFAAARIAAAHCPELVARGPRPEERAAMLTAWRRDLARHLAQPLGDLLSGDKLAIAVSAPEWLKGSDILARIGPVAANSLLRCGMVDGPMAAGAEGGAVLLSLDHATALALAERSFGGDGRVGAPSLDPLPRSALLLIDEVAGLVAEALSTARLGDARPGATNAAGARGEVMVRSENAARLRAFDPAADCALITIQITSPQGSEWIASLALAADTLSAVLPDPDGRAAGAATPGHTRHPGPLAAPFGTIPLPLRAVLAEFELTLTQLHRLAPGDTIPLAMPRSVPLRLGDALVAQGSIGTLEDRMALCLTHVPAPGILATQFSAKGVTQ